MTSKKKVVTKEKLTKPVSFRLTTADHAAYLGKVEASGMKASEFFRDCVMGNKTQVIARPKASVEKDQIIYLFNKTSNNMNQLAHKANAAHLAGSVSEATYADILAELQTLADLMKAAIKNVD
jgi:endonuclease YncB( thermonuclease family)